MTSVYQRCRERWLWPRRTEGQVCVYMNYLEYFDLIHSRRGVNRGVEEDQRHHPGATTQWQYRWSFKLVLNGVHSHPIMMLIVVQAYVEEECHHRHSIVGVRCCRCVWTPMLDSDFYRVLIGILGWVPWSPLDYTFWSSSSTKVSVPSRLI